MIPSPCIGLCRIDEGSGLCLGCAYLAQGGDMPTSLPIPEAYIHCAIHYPDPPVAARDTGPPEGH